MDKSKLVLFVFVAFGAVLACDIGLQTTASVSKPTVAIGSPPHGSEFRAGQEILVQANASDAAGIARVELWVDNLLVTTTQPPTPQPQFSAILRWTATPGTHTLTVKAINTASVTSDPASVAINVLAPVTPTQVPAPPTPLPTQPPVPATAPAQPITVDVIPTRAVLPTVAPTLPPPIVLPPCPPASAMPAGMLSCEDFASKEIAASRGWYFGVGTNVDYTWSLNRFIVTVKPKDWMGYSWANGDYDNFGAEVEAQPVGDDYAEYGLAFRITGEESVRNYYSIGITSDGKYLMSKKIAGKWSDVSPVERTPTPFVRTGKNKNLIGVIAQGGTFAIYINRVLVNTITDNALAKGAVGVHADTGKETSNAIVAFSRVTILTPDKARAEWATVPSATQPSGAPTFSAVTFSTAFDDKAWTPINPGKVFPYGVKTIFAYWTYSGVVANTNFEYEWLFNNARVDSDSDRFAESSGKSAQWLVHPRSPDIPLDRGNYQFNVRIGGQVVISETFVIQ